MIDLDRSFVNRLLYFYFVAGCKNISHAAREANLHQSAMSRQMLKLEEEIGMCLMNRHKNGITLTSEGEELFESARRIFGEIYSIRRALDEKEGISGKIRICTTYAIANYILLEHLINFKKQYPNIYFNIVCSDHTIDVIKNNVDVIIRPYDPCGKDLFQEHLFNIQGKLYASTEYIKENGFPKKYEDIKKHKFITFSRIDLLPFNSQYVNWFSNIEGYTVQKNSVMEANSPEILHAAAQAGLGLISSYSNMMLLKKSNLINVAPNIKGPLLKHYFCFSNQKKCSKKIQVLKEYLKENLVFNI